MSLILIFLSDLLAQSQHKKELKRSWPHGKMSEHLATVSLLEGYFSPWLINLTTTVSCVNWHFGNFPITSFL